MGKLIDLTGQKFGRLTVMGKYGKNKSGSINWICKCSCGGEKIVSSSGLRHGGTQSCGCLQKELIGNVNKSHGKSKTRLYKIWKHMKERCYKENLLIYENYGGRGIIMCEEWKNDSMSFYNWAMANGYSDNLSIDRIDVNGNYEPSNCRWADRKTQNNNRRNCRSITYNGETHTISEWAEMLNIENEVLRRRIVVDNWDIDKAMNPKNYSIREITYQGKTQSCAKWARELNIKPATLSWRLKKGWDIKEALTTPAIKFNKK